jgi:hypothetical protein
MRWLLLAFALGQLVLGLLLWLTPGFFQESIGPNGARNDHYMADAVALATVAAVERGAPGVYDIVDDDPGPTREWVPAYARAVGAKPPRRVPLWLARLVAGGAAATMSTTLRGASNTKAKRELGWHPRWSRCAKASGTRRVEVCLTIVRLVNRSGCARGHVQWTT